VTAEFPVGDPLANLAPTARRIVETARRLLIERGYGALSLENIAGECQLNKTAVRYYFGNKAGLMEIVVDSLAHDNSSFMLEGLDVPAGKARIHAFVDMKRERVVENVPLAMAFLELLPNILRDRGQTERIIELYEWLIGAYTKFFAREVTQADANEIRGLAQLLIAVLDGLSIQYSLDKERFRTSPACTVLESMLVRWLGDKEWAVNHLS
jgi:AcrR family transcriptional regulator